MRQPGYPDGRLFVSVGKCRGAYVNLVGYSRYRILGSRLTYGQAPQVLTTRFCLARSLSSATTRHFSALSLCAYDHLLGIAALLEVVHQEKALSYALYA